MMNSWQMGTIQTRSNYEFSPPLCAKNSKIICVPCSNKQTVPPHDFFIAFLLYYVCTQTNFMQRLELTMGRDIPDNGTVTDHMMDNFIKSEIMPHFEYGTFIDGEGLWKGKREQTKIFYLEVEDREVEDMLLTFNCIAAAYRKQFRQDSVLVSQVQTNAIFI